MRYFVQRAWCELIHRWRVWVWHIGPHCSYPYCPKCDWEGECS